MEGVRGTASPAGLSAGRLTGLLALLVRDVRVERLSGRA